MITIKLTYPHANPQAPSGEQLLYRVKQVIGSVNYVPGQYLPKAHVNDLCNATGMFKVIVDEVKD